MRQTPQFKTIFSKAWSGPLVERYPQTYIKDNQTPQNQCFILLQQQPSLVLIKCDGAKQTRQSITHFQILNTFRFSADEHTHRYVDRIQQERRRRSCGLTRFGCPLGCAAVCRKFTGFSLNETQSYLGLVCEFRGRVHLGANCGDKEHYPTTTIQRSDLTIETARVFHLLRFRLSHLVYVSSRRLFKRPKSTRRCCI